VIGGDVAEQDRIIRFVLRLSPELHERLRALAARERRSLHGQILYLLEQALDVEHEGKEAA
jgi:hypothetical protein